MLLCHTCYVLKVGLDLTMLTQCLIHSKDMKDAQLLIRLNGALDDKLIIYAYNNMNL